MLTILDVSMWQGAVNWRRVKQDGIELVFMKATDGAGGTDPHYRSNRQACDELGIRCGAYHFAEPSTSSPIAQADHFAAVVGKPRRRELRPVLDLETGGPTRTEGFAREWCQHVAHKVGCMPLFYTYSAYAAAMQLRKPIGGGLWLASYGRNDGQDYGAGVPRPWKHWVAHQFTSNGRTGGVDGHVDVSHAPKLRPLLAHPITGRL